MRSTHIHLLTAAVMASLLAGAGCAAEDGVGGQAALDDVGETVDLAPDARPLLWLDDQRILFSRELPHGVMIVSLDGEVTLEAFPLASENNWKLSPDGTEIAYVLANEPGTSGGTLYVESLDDEDAPRRAIVEGDGLQLVSWTVDGRWLVYNDPDESWTQAVPSAGGNSQDYLSEDDAEGSASVQIPPEGTLPPQMPTSQPMGEELYIQLEPEEDYGEWESWEGGWKLRQDNLTGTERCSGFIPSPDGRLVACTHIVEDDLSLSDEGEDDELFGAVIRLRP
jgi:hypothetical protein